MNEVSQRWMLNGLTTACAAEKADSTQPGFSPITDICSVNPESLGAGAEEPARFRYLDISSISHGQIDWSATKVYSRLAAPSRAQRVVRVGDVLISTVRPGLKAHGIIRGSVDLPLVASTGFAVLRPHRKSDSAYLFHQLFGEAVASQLRAKEVGTNYPAVNERDVETLNVFAHSADEREAIGNCLDYLDEAIEGSRAVIAKLKHLRSGLLHDLLTRGLDENGKLRDPCARPTEFQQTQLGIIPRTWDVTQIGKVLLESPRNGYNPPESSTWTGRFMLGLGCLSLDGFRPSQLKAAPNDPALESFLLRDGDLLISRSNTQELVALPGRYQDIGAPCFYPDLMMRLRPNAKIAAEFLELLLRYSRSRRYLVASANGTSGSMVKITGAGLMRVPIAFPPANESEEQQRILGVKVLVDGEIVQAHNELDKLLMLKRALAQDLLTGHVRVPSNLFGNGS